MAAAIFVLAGPLIYAWLGTGASTVDGRHPGAADPLRGGRDSRRRRDEHDAAQRCRKPQAGRGSEPRRRTGERGVECTADRAVRADRRGLWDVDPDRLRRRLRAVPGRVPARRASRSGTRSCTPSCRPCGPRLWRPAFLFVVRANVPPSLWGVLLASAVAGVVYLGLFIGVAISPRERSFYIEKAKQVFERRPKVPGDPSRGEGAIDARNHPGRR